MRRIDYQAGLGLKSFIYANFGLNLMLAASMQLLWGLINSLQLLVRTPLMNLNFPLSTKLFFNNFVMVTNFDILPSQELNAYFFNFHESDEFNERFSEMGYDSLNCIDNIGSYLYYLIIIGILLGLSGFLYLISRSMKLPK